jgi:OmpA-OmpF porin, OOP family
MTKIGSVLFGVALVIAAAPARGDDLSKSRFEPAEPGSDWFTLESLDLRGASRFQAGAMFDWGYAPNAKATDVVRMHARGAWIYGERLRLGLAMPVALYRYGDGPVSAAGDLRTTGDVRVFGAFNSYLRGAWGYAFYFPTGSRHAGTTDGTFRLTPRFSLSGGYAAAIWAGRLGYALVRDEIVYGFSVGIKVNDRFVLGPELSGVTSLRSGKAPIELLLGGRVTILDALRIGTAIGGGITDAEGAPRLRVLAVVEYAPDVCVDKDGDGICEPYDACPEVAGLRTRDRRTNGCPAIPP